MTAALEQSDPALARLVQLAQGGDEVILTRDGTAVAKIIAMPSVERPPSSDEIARRREWLADLKEHAERASTGKVGGPTTEKILDELRAERL